MFKSKVWSSLSQFNSNMLNTREPLRAFQYLKYLETEIIENLPKTTLSFRIDEIKKKLVISGKCNLISRKCEIWLFCLKPTLSWLKFVLAMFSSRK